MKTNATCTLLSGILAVSLLARSGKAEPKEVEHPPTTSAAVPAPSIVAMTQFTPRPGSKVRLEGGTTMISGRWRVESTVIGGFLNVGAGFPTEPGQAATPGKAAAEAEVFIPVTTLKSVEEDGTHYSDAMDNTVYDKLKAETFKKIEYHLTELVLKQAAMTKDAPYLFDAKGALVIAGVTNAIEMPVQVLPLGDKKLKIAGALSLKMSSFNVTPPTAFDGGPKAYDEVRLSFEWILAPKGSPAPSAAK